LNWNYQAPWWLPGGDVQTIYAAKVAKRYLGELPSWQRTRWQTPDDDFIDLDWLTASNSVDKVPLLVLFHGLEGSSRSHYAQAFAQAAQAKGWHMVVPHFRGCSGELNRAPRAYHSGDYLEIDWILRRLKQSHPGPIYVVGISLGGNALMCWAAESGTAAHGVAHAVVSVCSPLDLMASGHAIDSGLNQWMYARMFLQTMKPAAMAKLAQYPGLFDAHKMMQAQTLYEFDDVFTAPLHGFKGVDDYWTRASAKPRMGGIRIPALAINAINDPFVPASSLPRMQDVSRHVVLWQPKDGGHVGFTGGDYPGNLLGMPQAVLDWMTHG
jgi:predicted alpha/beta-fold hydrolase